MDRGQAQRPTMKDVAAAAGVSRALVSIVFRNAPGASSHTRQKVLQAAERLGYQRDTSARTLRTGRTHLIGLVFDSRDDFHADFLDAAYPAAQDQGFDLLLSAVTAGRSQETAIATLTSSRVEGIILLGSRDRSEAYPDHAGDARVVVVGWTQNQNADVVRTDEVSGVRDAVEHLVRLGHRDIACVEAIDHPAGADRVAGYLTAMNEKGLGHHVRVLAGDFTHHGGREAAQLLLNGSRPLPTAVIACNDSCAAGLIQTLRATDVNVPGDVSVVGFDGSHLAASPDLDLSTVEQDVRALARLACAVVLTPATGNLAAPVKHVLRPRLLLRSTTGPVRTDRSVSE